MDVDVDVDVDVIVDSGKKDDRYRHRRWWGRPYRNYYYPRPVVVDVAVYLPPPVLPPPVVVAPPVVATYRPPLPVYVPPPPPPWVWAAWFGLEVAAAATKWFTGLVMPSFFAATTPILLEATDQYNQGNFPTDQTTFYEADKFAPVAPPPATAPSSSPPSDGGVEVNVQQQQQQPIYAYYNKATEYYQNDPCDECVGVIYNSTSDSYTVIGNDDTAEEEGELDAAAEEPSQRFTWYDPEQGEYATEGCDACVPVLYDELTDRYHVTGVSDAADNDASLVFAAPAPDIDDEDIFYDFYSDDESDLYTTAGTPRAVSSVEIIEEEEADGAAAAPSADEGATVESVAIEVEDDNEEESVGRFNSNSTVRFDALIGDYVLLLAATNASAALGGAEAYTVFAPTDDAIRAGVSRLYPDLEGVESLVTTLQGRMDDDVALERLRKRVLNSIVVGERVRLHEAAPAFTVTPMCGPALSVSPPSTNATGFVRVGGARVLLANLPSSGARSLLTVLLSWPAAEFADADVDAWTCLRDYDRLLTSTQAQAWMTRDAST